MQSDMKTGELVTRSMAQAGKIERHSTARVARQVCVQRAAHSKNSSAEETYTQNPEGQKWGSYPCACRKNKEDTPENVREYQPYGPMQRQQPEVYSRTYDVEKLKADERKTRR